MGIVTTTRELESKAEQVVDAVIKDFTDRRGLRQGWDQIDRETRKEIRAEWVRLTAGVLATIGKEPY